MKLIDPASPFFRPAWRRWATAMLPGLWALVEFGTGNAFWGIIFGSAAVYAAWVLIVAYPPAE